jgi:multidrug efflux pump subunit AcrB
MKRYSYSIVMVFAVLTLAGLFLVPRLSVQLNPSQGSGNLTVSYTWANVSPEVIERLVTSKLEGAFSTLQGIRKVSSVSLYGSGYITLELDKNAPLDRIRFETAMLLRQLYPSLPADISFPVIRLNSPDEETKEKPLLILQLNGDASSSELQRFAEEQLKPELSYTEGVYEVNVYGGNMEEWVLTYNQDQLDNLHITENEILTALQNHFRQSSLGTAGVEQQGSLIHQISVNLSGYRLDANASGLFDNITIKQHNGRIIYLTDIVGISRQERPPVSFYRINGKNAVNLIITANAGVNQLTVVDLLKDELIRLQKKFPSAYRVSVEYDSTTFIRENLHKIYIQSGAAILILLVFVWLTTLSWRYTGLIALSLIVNLALSFILFYFLKTEIHIYSLAALTTSLGIIIDNVIVMIDHYKRYRTLKVFTALLGATLTTVSGLVVIEFLPEEAQANLSDFARVMIITLLVSLLVALFFIPALIERNVLGAGHETEEKQGHNNKFCSGFSWLSLYSKLLPLLIRWKKPAFLIAVLTFGLPVFMLPAKIEQESSFAGYYNKIIGNEYYTDNIKPWVDKTLGGTLRLFVNYVYEKSHYTQSERTALYIQAGLPNQSTIEQMNSLFLQFERELSGYAEIDRFITNIYNGQNGQMIIYFKTEAEKGSFPYVLKSRMVGLSTEMSGINCDIYGVGQGFSQNLDENATPTFNVAMYGYNYGELEKQALVLKEKLEKHPRIQEVNINKSPNFWDRKNLYEFVLTTNPSEMALRNTNLYSVYQGLMHYDLRSPADIRQLIGGQYEYIKVRPEQTRHFDIWHMKHIPLQTDSAELKVGDFVTIEKQKVSPTIYKEDQQYIRFISFEYFGSSVFGEKFLDKTLEEMKLILPVGYMAKEKVYDWFSGESKYQYSLLALIILIIYIICAIIFESLLQPLALILLIPLSFIGVFLSFYWFDFNFDQGGYASFVLLSGNVVCAGIFIIAEYNNLRNLHPQSSDIEIYLLAFQHKIVPIWLTVLSTVVGLVPFLMFGQDEAFWFALGVGTIGGLMMSIIIIILYLPLLLNIKTGVQSRKLKM